MHNEVVESPAAYYDLILNNKIRISQIVPVSKEMMRVSYEDEKAFITEHGASNVVVALWTTR